MDKKTGIYITAILALILIITLILIYLPAYSQTYPEKTFNQSELNESQLSLLNDIWGTNITMGEYYELIYPEEYLNGIPPELRSQMNNTAMKWPENVKHI